MKNLKLTIELVPKTAWYTNVRSNVSRPEWDKIRKECYKRANYHCEICHDQGMNQGAKWPVECHEIWSYDDLKCVQTLTGLISLCPRCHKAKHPGLAQINGEIEIVYGQLMRVNKMTRIEAESYLQTCFEVWQDRSAYSWTCNVEYLKIYFVKQVIEPAKIIDNDSIKDQW